MNRIIGIYPSSYDFNIPIPRTTLLLLPFFASKLEQGLRMTDTGKILLLFAH